MRLIDADSLMKAMYHRAFGTDNDTMWQSGCWVQYEAIEQVVNEQPTVNAQPSKLGHWIKDGHHITCDQCGQSMCDKDREGDTIPQNFCPNCGSENEW